MTRFMLLLLLAAGQDAAVQAPPETGSVRGRITDADSGRPIPAAVVRLRQPGTTKQQTVTVGSDGTYEFTALTWGMYTVDASGGEYDATYIARGYGSPPSRPAETTAFMLRAGETKSGVDIALQRSGAISGRVTDDGGEPLTGIVVWLLRAPGGERAPAPISRPTDDRGAFRIFGVRPGRFFVCAAVERPMLRVSSAPPIRMPLPTCHPSESDGSLGQEVAFEGGELGGIELRMPRRPLLTLTGTVLGADGLPAAGVELSISPFSGTAPGQLGGVMLRAQSAHFTMGSLAPGRYTLTATRGQFGPPGTSEWAVQQLDLAGDEEHVMVTLQRAALVKGRVVFEGDAPPEGMKIAIHSEAAFLVGGGKSARPAMPVDPDLTFELNAMSGPHLIVPTDVPAGWLVKAVRYRGEDITNLPTVFQTGRDELEVVLTRRRAYLSGRVIDMQGEAATGARVLAIPAERARWPQFNVRGPSAIVKDGQFRLEQRAGEYLVLAMSADDYDSMGSDVPFSMIERAAQRISLAEDERRELDLRLVPLTVVR